MLNVQIEDEGGGRMAIPLLGLNLVNCRMALELLGIRLSFSIGTRFSIVVEELSDQENICN